MEARGEAATAVHYRALLRKFPQDATPSEGRRYHSFIKFRSHICYKLFQ